MRRFQTCAYLVLRICLCRLYPLLERFSHRPRCCRADGAERTSSSANRLHERPRSPTIRLGTVLLLGCAVALLRRMPVPCTRSHLCPLSQQPPSAQNRRGVQYLLRCFVGLACVLTSSAFERKRMIRTRKGSCFA